METGPPFSANRDLLLLADAAASQDAAVPSHKLFRLQGGRCVAVDWLREEVEVL